MSSSALVSLLFCRWDKEILVIYGDNRDDHELNQPDVKSSEGGLDLQRDRVLFGEEWT